MPPRLNAEQTVGQFSLVVGEISNNRNLAGIAALLLTVSRIIFFFWWHRSRKPKLLALKRQG
jgi:hypothetical protein